ncbi:MAG: DUF6353 family protein [Vallitaleaceae bacterium]|nr:DUF6353 family protein [Vallitaleaceae bacterium]
MMKNKFMTNVNRTFKKVQFGVVKHSPEILITVGVVGVLASTVMACKATTKLDTIIDKTKENIFQIKDCVADQGLTEYTEEDSKKDLVIVYTKAAVNVAKLYAPAVGLGILSLTSIVASNNILRKRNVALTAAYVAVDQSFKEYKRRVIERFGEQVEKEIRYNIKTHEYEETVVNEKGKEKQVKKSALVSEAPINCSPYAKFFDASSSDWVKDADYNLMWLKAQESYANNLLIANGYLFLNDVYSILGIPKTKAGQVVGWRYDPNDTTIDNYVDFGIHTLNQANINFVNGYEPVILLDFNVDGDIWNTMPETI